MIVVSAIRQRSMKNYPACLSIVRFSHFPALKTEIFLLSEPLFLRLELLCGTTIAAVIGQAVVDLKLEVISEITLTQYYFHDRRSILRSDDR